MKRALAALALVAYGFAPGTTHGVEDASPLPVWHVGPYLGGARNSPGGDHWGATSDRDHLFLGVRGSAPLLRWKRLALAFAPEIVPVLVVTDNPKYRTITVMQGGVSRSAEIEYGRGPVLGAGITPLGLEALVRIQPRIQLFGAVAVGTAWFTRDVPVGNSRDFNYTNEMGGGLLWEYRARRRLRLGYKFHHLSNNWTAVANPGLDGDVFYLGWETTVGRGGE